MKKLATGILALILALSLFAMAQAGDDDKTIASCKYCGMDRAKFSHSRMFIEYTDGTVVGTCSLHCAAIDLALNIDKTPRAIMVGDYASRTLIEAERASWVIGGSAMGVMTKNAKWAFANQGDAAKFVNQNGGVFATYDEAMKAAYGDMYADTKMIRDKRKMVRAKQHEH
jgi:copper chaperone NosL